MSTISPELNELLTEWAHSEQQAKIWSDREKALREQIFHMCFPTPLPGTKDNKLKLPLGHTLVGDYRLNYSVDRAALETLRGDAAALPIIEQIVTYRPEVSGSKFRSLTDNEKAVAAQFVTEKPGTPGLEIKIYKRG